MRREVLTIAVLVCTVCPPARADVVTAPPTYDQLVGCWVGLGGGGTLFRLCLAQDSTATLRYESTTRGEYLLDRLSDITLASGKLTASIQGDGYPEAVAVTGDASSFERICPEFRGKRRMA